MNLALIAVAVVVLFVGALGAKTIANNSEVPTPVSTPEVKAEQTSEAAQTSAPSATETTASTPSPSATVIPTPITTPKPDVTSGDWVYPGAKTLESGDKLILESSDSSDAVTAWYKSKIEAEGYNIRNSIKTSANGVVKNVVQAARGNKSVNVEISTSPSNSTKIEVETTSL